MTKTKKIILILAFALTLCICADKGKLIANASELFTLTATPNGDENYVKLEWTSPDTEDEYTYMIYQKNANDTSDNYQTIPAKDVVKVLQIYPYTNQLVGWVNAYGQGKITCDSMHIDTFNSNPSVIWGYDVIVFGFWDSNNGKDISNAGLTAVKQYIEKGYGVLFGHDTISSNNSNRFRSLEEYVNLRLANSSIYWQNVSCNGSTVTIQKKGLLTNYPYQIGDVGTVLTIPYAHTIGQEALGDIWMTFTNQPYPLYKAYLTTWNNCALIQTGHSNGAATEDEQKLIMNTLYYLAQKTEATEWEDHMSQDLTPPETPVLQDLSIHTNSQTVTVQMTSKDFGSSYEYYIEATSNSTGNKIQSNTASAYIEGGLKGYSVVVDQNPDTIPDLTVETLSDTYTFSVTNDYILAEPVYVHIRAIDKFGNGSETIHESFIYTEPICDYDGRLDFLLDEYPTVEIKFAIGTSSINLSQFKEAFFASLEERGIREEMFSFDFISYTTNEEFMNLLEHSAWEEHSLRYLIHISDNVSFFTNTTLRAQVLERVKEEQIHYIGFGNASIQTQTLQFITDNEGRGVYLYSGNMSLAIRTLTDYLVWHITFPEGSGTENDPFVLRTGGQCTSIRYLLDGYFVLGQDIDMRGNIFYGIGDWDNPFTGHIDGKGYSIGNFKMYKEEDWDYVGFIRVAYQAHLTNIYLNDVYIHGGRYVGGLVGYAYGNETVIKGCTIGEATIQGDSYVGGIAGYLEYGTMEECESFATIYGKYYVGGIAGYAKGSILRNIFTAATVTGVEYVGGILGYSDYNLVDQCQSLASLVGYEKVGGLLGYHNGVENGLLIFKPIVSNCESIATVKGSQYIGGIIGYGVNAETENCLSVSTLEGENHIGELVGYTES